MHSPVHSYVNAIHPLANGGLLTCSLRYGIVARSHPLTGKVVKGFLSASGGGAGLGIGNPNLEFAPDATACALTSEGATARVAWGYRNGQLAIVIAKKAMDGKAAAYQEGCGYAAPATCTCYAAPATCTCYAASTTLTRARSTMSFGSS